MTSRRVAVIFGAGDGLGGAIARRFARGDYHACVVRRHADKLEGLCEEIREAGGTATAFGVDARKEEPVVEFFEQVENEIGPIEVAVHNIGANVSIPIVEFEARKFFKIWEMACFSRMILRRAIGCFTTRRAVPGPSSWICARSWSRGSEQSLA